MQNNGVPQDFEAIKARLDEIVDAVNDDSIPLDDALDLYEEAVALGMRVSEVLEEGIKVDDAALDDPADAEADAAGAATAAPTDAQVNEESTAE